jgi:hypothetical protein
MVTAGHLAGESRIERVAKSEGSLPGQRHGAEDSAPASACETIEHHSVSVPAPRGRERRAYLSIARWSGDPEVNPCARNGVDAKKPCVERGGRHLANLPPATEKGHREVSGVLVEITVAITGEIRRRQVPRVCAREAARRLSRSGRV